MSGNKNGLDYSVKYDKEKNETEIAVSISDEQAKLYGRATGFTLTETYLRHMIPREHEQMAVKLGRKAFFILSLR